VRLFSMLHAAALNQVEKSKVEAFDVIDNGNLDDESLALLEHVDNEASDASCGKSNVIHAWIEHEIIKNMSDGVLCHIPPPILTRVFQELATGNQELNEALAITHVPFPFPYVQMASAMLIVHTIMTPVVITNIMEGYVATFLVSFLTVATLWAINLVAAEIQQPFGNHSNNLPMTQMHDRLHQGLILLLDGRLNRSPHIPATTISEPSSYLGRMTTLKRMSAGAAMRLSVRGSDGEQILPNALNPSDNKAQTPGHPDGDALVQNSDFGPIGRNQKPRPANQLLGIADAHAGSPRLVPAFSEQTDILPLQTPCQSIGTLQQPGSLERRPGEPSNLADLLPTEVPSIAQACISQLHLTERNPSRSLNERAAGEATPTGRRTGNCCA